MFLKRAMRYYRFWIYSCNLALLLGVLLFVALAATVISDFRLSFLPSVKPHLPTLVYAYFAVFIQGGLLQFIGCFGAVRMSERLLTVYWVLLLVLLCGDVITGVVWIFRYSSIVGSLCSDLKTRMDRDYEKEKDFRALWDRLQIEFQCCGVNGPMDFNLTISTSWTDSNRTVEYHQQAWTPLSCCKSQLSNSTTCEEEFVHQQGCCDVVHRWLQRSADMLAVMGFCVIAFLKMCFLAILRYEIKEMIEKIQVLKSTKDRTAVTYVAGETNIPYHLQRTTTLSRESSRQRPDTPPPLKRPRSRHRPLVRQPNNVSQESELKDGGKNPNGNNNEDSEMSCSV